ncbi:hypothetical protein RI129_009104 [Pyrocoelia pectoralis]|uniref:LITAF domain-containing protein n=1 Tax=Pyrocoelia pectoralis TaxID=417401 RepID=A0AAN7ZI10_9COLE
MQKDLPPPYSEATAPNVGFNLPPNPAQPPPPPGYVGQMPTSHVYAGQPVMSAPAAFGPNSATLTCPYCHKGVTTVVRAESSSKTHLFAVLLCFVSCCCIPYCMDSCKNKNHYCPSCNAFLGAYTN